LWWFNLHGAGLKVACLIFRQKLEVQPNCDDKIIMSKILFRLRNVPDDEATEVRVLLEQNNIEYFETFAGNWGISLPALWIKDESLFETARELIDAYQEERRIRIRGNYEQSRMRGETLTLWQSFRENPVRFIVYTSLAAIVLYFSVLVFLAL